MTSRTLGQKIGLATFFFALCGGCATQVPPAAKRSDSAAPQRVQPSPQMVKSIESSQTASPVPHSTPALVVHIDPDTGQVRSDPPASTRAGEVRQPLFQSPPAAAPQVLELPSPTLGGGVMVHLNGQFHTPLVATVDAEGNIRFQHRPGMPLQIPAK